MSQTSQIERDIVAYATAPHTECLCEFRVGTPGGPAADVTGWTVAVDFRTTPEAPTPLLEATEGNGRITWDRPDGRVFLSLSADDLTLLAGSQPFYDVRVERPGANLWIPRRGRIRVLTPVTR